MTFSQILISVLETLAVVFTVYCLFHEQKIAKIERRLAKKVIRYFVKRHRAKQNAKNRSHTSRRPVSVCSAVVVSPDEVHSVA